MRDRALEAALRFDDPGRRLNSLREYLQAFIMRSLHESEASRAIAFVGGTALRFLENLPRFSEDLDFSQVSSDRYEPVRWLSKLKRDLHLAGFDSTVRWMDRTPIDIGLPIGAGCFVPGSPIWRPASWPVTSHPSWSGRPTQLSWNVSISTRFWRREHLVTAAMGDHRGSGGDSMTPSVLGAEVAGAGWTRLPAGRRMGHVTQPLDPLHTRAPSFSPRSGAPGTEITVETRDLPALTPVYLGMGAARANFEVLSQLVTTERGEMSTVVEVPDWATADRTHYFVLVDVYFRPLAVSAAFHVTEPDGTLRRRGRIEDGAGGCPTLREAGEGQELYVLTGDVQNLSLGDEVLVEATLGESPRCGQGTALQVTRTERLD